VLVHMTRKLPVAVTRIAVDPSVRGAALRVPPASGSTVTGWVEDQASRVFMRQAPMMVHPMIQARISQTAVVVDSVRQKSRPPPPKASGSWAGSRCAVATPTRLRCRFSGWGRRARISIGNREWRQRARAGSRDRGRAHGSI
jgi:hypothetical protein